MPRLGLPCFQERERIQKEFCERKIQVVVATLAFGMGLDVTHVRSVVHLNLPRSLEEYVQQVHMTASAKLTILLLAKLEGSIHKRQRRCYVDRLASARFGGVLGLADHLRWFPDTCPQHEEHAWLEGLSGTSCEAHSAYRNT